MKLRHWALTAAGGLVALSFVGAAAANADPFGTGRDGAGLMPYHLKLAWCHYNGQGASAGNVCRRALVRLSPRELNDSNNYLKTACHEVGHAVGLSHNPPYDTDCMISGWVGRRYTTYSAHHRSHISSGRISLQ